MTRPQPTLWQRIMRWRWAITFIAALALFAVGFYVLLTMVITGQRTECENRGPGYEFVRVGQGRICVDAEGRIAR